MNWTPSNDTVTSWLSEFNLLPPYRWPLLGFEGSRSTHILPPDSHVALKSVTTFIPWTAHLTTRCLRTCVRTCLLQRQRKNHNRSSSWFLSYSSVICIFISEWSIRYSRSGVSIFNTEHSNGRRMSRMLITVMSMQINGWNVISGKIIRYQCIDIECTLD
jgi:hypothetical protein